MFQFTGATRKQYKNILIVNKRKEEKEGKAGRCAAQGCCRLRHPGEGQMRGEAEG